MGSGFEKARSKVMRSAAKSAAAAAIPFALVRVPTLTGITSSMGEGIMEAYGYKSLRGPANFLSVAIGACTGVALANEILDLFPGIGTFAASAATATLHIITGSFLILLCELMQVGAITEEELQDTAFCKALCNEWLGKVAKITLKIATGRSPVELAYAT